MEKIPQDASQCIGNRCAKAGESHFTLLPFENKSQMSVLVSSRGIYTEIIMDVVLINFKKRIQNLSLAGELTGRGSINPLSLESKHFEYIYPLINFLLVC